MTKTIYDYPLYYDILFGWDRSAEAAFYDCVFERAGVDRDELVLEVACGTGQIAIRLAGLNRSVVGMDNSPGMLAYLESRASAEGAVIRTVCADMTTFSDRVVYGAAFNPLSSFRLLQTDDEAESHLQAMAASLRVGGLYVLDLEFRERMDEPPTTTDQEWEMSRWGITVRATDDLIYVDDHGRKLELPWGEGGHLRNYTCAAFVDLVSASGSFVIESCHPEGGREGDEGVSVFDPDKPSASCSAGRAMVVLRRD